MDDVTFQLVLTGSHLLDGLLQHCETPHHLLHLGWVEGGGAGRFRRYDFRSGGFGTGRCRPANLLDRARDLCFVCGDQPSSGAFVAIICFAASP